MVTKKTMARAYELLKGLKPFKDWSLPPRSKVTFAFVREKNVLGFYQPIEEGKHTIEISKGVSLNDLMLTMAHEMVHMKQCLQGRKTIEKKDTQEDWHDKEFRKLAREVCRNLGFKIKEF